MRMIDKILYIRAIWFVVAGLFAIIIGFRFCSQQPKSLDDLEQISGRVTSIEQVELYSRTFDSSLNCTVLYIDSIATAYTYGSKHQAILDNAKINLGDYCQMWGEIEPREYLQSGGTVIYKIRALSIRGKQIISFRKQAILSIYIFIYALIIFVPALIFVVKEPQILFGKGKLIDWGSKDEKEESTYGKIEKMGKQQ